MDRLLAHGRAAVDRDEGELRSDLREEGRLAKQQSKERLGANPADARVLVRERGAEAAN